MTMSLPSSQEPLHLCRSISTNAVVSLCRRDATRNGSLSPPSPQWRIPPLHLLAAVIKLLHYSGGGGIPAVILTVTFGL
jgi:hypothetical protein